MAQWGPDRSEGCRHPFELMNFPQRSRGGIMVHEDVVLGWCQEDKGFNDVRAAPSVVDVVEASC
jgi:hypothetical protein